MQLLAKLWRQGHDVIYSTGSYVTTVLAFDLVVCLLVVLGRAVEVYDQQRHHHHFLRQVSIFHQNDDVRRLATGMGDLVQHHEPLPSVFGIPVKPTLRNVILSAAVGVLLSGIVALYSQRLGLH